MSDISAASRGLRHQLDDLVEGQRWVHHVADLASGVVHTAESDRPIGPVTRVERLAGVGHAGDTAFGGPRYLLTPRRPYQASPEASLIAAGCSYSTTDDVVIWQPPSGADRSELALRVFFSRSPDGRSVVSLLLSGSSWPGATGHVTIRDSQSAGSLTVPIAGTFAEHLVDFTFVPLAGRLADVMLTIEPGVRMLTFRSIGFGLQPIVATQALA